MKALLVRHAAAISRGTPGVLDDERPLASSAEIKFRVAARGLARLGPRPDVLLTSPLARAHATADIAARAFGGLDVRIEPTLVGESLSGVIAALNAQPRDATVALFGHQPMLGALLAHLLGMAQGEGFAFKKAGAALIDLPEGPGTPGWLLWFLDPRVLRAIGDGTRVPPTVRSVNGRAKPPSE